MNKLKHLLLSTILSVWLGTSAKADTVIYRNGTQLVGTVIHQSTRIVSIDVKGVPYSTPRSDVVDVILTGGAPEKYPSSFGEFEDRAESIHPSTANAQEAEAFPFSNLPVPNPPETPTETPTSSIQSGLYPGAEVPGQAGEAVVDGIKPMLPVVTPSGKAYQITGAGVRFRNGPSLDYPIVTTLPSRTVLIEIEMTDGWLHAKTLDGTEGWIHLNFVQPMQNEPVIVTGDNLHVREAAGEIYRSLERLRRGEIVIKLDESPGWWLVLTNDSVAGWASEEYLELIENPAALTPSMRVVQNEAANRPINIEKRESGDGGQTVTFTVRDEHFVVNGKTKLCVLRNNSSVLEYSADNILQRESIGSSSAIMQAGFPESLAVQYTSMDILTLLGARTTGGWQYTLTIPSQEEVAFAFILQEGPYRGTVVVAP